MSRNVFQITMQILIYSQSYKIIQKTVLKVQINTQLYILSAGTKAAVDVENIFKLLT